MNETVKLQNGETKEIELKFLDFRVISTIKSQVMKPNKIYPDGTAEGNFEDLLKIPLMVLDKVLKDVKVEDLMPEECERIYNTHYAKYFDMKNKQEKK